MTPIPASHGLHNDQQRSAHIRSQVLALGAELRQRYPILQHQDALGAGILAVALAGMIGSAWLYLDGAIAWWACLLANAFFASLTHELEHDLIHSMYFRKQRAAHNLMMALVWLARPSTINPWIRRHLHLNHHKVSGSETDIEERAITNGEPWGLARLLMVGDNLMSSLIRLLRAKTWAHRKMIVSRTLIGYAPLAVHLRRPPPADPQPWLEAFRAPVHFAAAEDVLCFARVDLDRPLDDGNPELAAHNEAVLRKRLDALQPDTVGRRLRRALEQCLPNGEPSAEVLAHGLHLSLRSLQRHLSEEGSSYEQVLAETRHALAVQHLGEADCSISEVAYLLGFADSSSFSRTGRSRRSDLSVRY